MFLISLQAFPQGRMVSGTVTDNQGEAIPGASIVEKGTTNGTTSDISGNFSILVQSDDAILQISFVGYADQEIPVNGNSVVNVTLLESVTSLEDVVVIGYGEVRKSDVTGAIASIRESEEIASQYNSVDMLLMGRASGLEVVGNSGAVNGAVSVRIRGTNSLRGNNEPLYVVDGVIISTAGTDVADPSTDANELQTQQNGLTGINPRDIESVEILKDASATAIYGSRGANGVVLITTKSGRQSERDLVNFYSTFEWSTISKKIDLLDAAGYAQYKNAADALKGFNPDYHIAFDNKVYPITYVGEDPVIGDVPLTEANWQNEIYQTSLSHNEGLSVNGGNEKSTYFFSAGFSDQRGIVETTRMRRGDLRLNLSQELSDRLTMQSRTSMMFQVGTFAQAGSKSGGNRSFTKQVLNYRPIIAVDETTEDLDLEISNPRAWLTDFDDKTREIRINSNLTLNYEILKGLKYKVSAGIDYRKKDRSKFYDLDVFVGQKENGLANYSYLDRYAYVIDNLLTYNRKIKKAHSINAVAGITYDGVHRSNRIYEVANFSDKSLRADYPQAGATIYRPFSNDIADERIFSALGRVNYSYRDKYVLTASYRADQSSKFRKDDQWGYFPAVALAWRAMEENFIKDLNIFYNLKLRLGWGLTGNQAIEPYQTLGTYSTVYYVDDSNSTIIGNVPARIPNPYLTWETTEQYNTGIDMAFFSGRLSATFDAYLKNTRDLLQEIELGPSNGATSMYVNRGTIENKGIELSVFGVPVQTDDLTIELGGNISFNRNKITTLGLQPTTVWINRTESDEILYFGNYVSTGTYFKQPANVFLEGYPVGTFWGWETDGIYRDDVAAADGPTFNGNPNAAGDVIFVDQNGDNNIDDLDKTVIGNPNPDFTYGFNLYVKYKDFSISALFNGVFGNEIINGYGMELNYAEGLAKNIFKDAYYQAWTLAEPSDTYPRVGWDLNEYLSDRNVEDGSYLRLNNLTVGYDISLERIKGLTNLNIYASGRNLFTLTRYSGYDPQVTSFLNDGTIMGVDWVGTPNVRTYMVGFNITF